jgi:outer membrane protein assembly factor BamB
MRCRLAVVGLVASMSVASPLLAETWSQFRGPGASGVASSQSLPDTWAAEKNIEWKAEIPGVAWSQPVVWGDKIYLTTAVSENQPKPRPQGAGGGGPGGGGFGGRPRSDGERPPGFETPPGDGDRPRGDDAPRSERSDRPSGQPAADGDGRPRGEGPPRGDAGRPGGNRGGFGGGPGGGRGGFGGRGASPPDAVYQWKVVCLDAKSGKVDWEKLAHEGKPTIAIHRTNTYASETPITDGERLYAYFGMTGLYCYDMQGKLLWSKELGSYPMMAGWGTGSSPVLDGDRLFVQCDNEENSFLVAFDKKTGEELWRKKRDERSNWSTPYIWKNKERIELVAGGSTMRSYDPATGEILWELGGMTGRCSATPVGDSQMLYVGTGGGMGGSGPLVAVLAGAKGDITLESGEKTNAGVAWSVSRAGPPMASPLLYEGNLYVLDQRGGIIACYDAATGDQHYKERLPGAKGFTSSPWAADGKVFCLDEDGQTFVLDAGPELKVLGTNKLDDMFWSSVSIAGNKLLLRGLDRLYCIGDSVVK